MTIALRWSEKRMLRLAAGVMTHDLSNFLVFAFIVRVRVRARLGLDLSNVRVFAFIAQRKEWLSSEQPSHFALRTSHFAIRTSADT